MTTRPYRALSTAIFVGVLLASCSHSPDKTNSSEEGQSPATTEKPADAKSEAEAASDAVLPPAEAIADFDVDAIPGEEASDDEGGDGNVARDPAEAIVSGGYGDDRPQSTASAKRRGVGERQRGKGSAKRSRGGGGGGGGGGRGAKSAPIWNRFYKDFKKCAPDCEPAQYGTWGSRGNASCHPSGQAVDVGAIKCGGTLHTALGGGKFATFVSCMRGKMKTLYRNGKHRTKGHHDHAHFSYGCTVRGRRIY